MKQLGIHLATLDSIDFVSRGVLQYEAMLDKLAGFSQNPATLYSFNLEPNLRFAAFRYRDKLSCIERILLSITRLEDA